MPAGDGRDPSEHEPDSAPIENTIVLSEEFWNEIQGHPIPVDLNVVRALADSPRNLDLYIWLIWRGYIEIGAEKFLLPVRSTVWILTKNAIHRNVTEFGNNRKFTSEMKIEFEKE